MISLRLAAVAFAAIVVLAVWYLGRPAPQAAAPSAISVAGWDDLGECAGTSSMDGKLWLELRSDGQAEISGGEKKAGRWIVRDNRYHVTFATETVAYTRIEVEGIVCMLLKGEAGSADLRSSWFSTVTQEPAPGPDDY